MLSLRSPTSPEQRVLLLAVLAFKGLDCFSQFLAFDRSYGGAGEEYARDVIQTADDGFLLVGGTGSYGPNASDQTPNGFLVKTTATGEVEWNIALGSSIAEGFTSAALGSNGDYLVAGTIWESGFSGDFDILVARIDGSGALIWTKRYGTNDRDEICAKILASGNDEFVIVGQRALGGGAQEGKVLAFRISGDGSLIWASSLDGGDFSSAKDAGISEDGSLFITGYRWYASDVDLFLLKVTPTGGLEWGNVYARQVGNTNGAGILVTTDGTCTIAGRAGNDLMISRTDPDGDLIWQGSYQCGDLVSASSLAPLDDGSFIVNGTVYLNNSQQSTHALFLFNSMGGLLDHELLDTLNRSADKVLVNGDHGLTLVGRINTEERPNDIELISLPAFTGSLPSFCTVLETPAVPSEPFIVMQTQPYVAIADPELNVTILSWTPVHDGASSLICGNIGLADKEHISTKVRCSPNPAVDIMTIIVPKPDVIEFLVVSDALGRTKFQFDRQVPLLLNVSSFAPGSYSCRGQFASGSRFNLAFLVQ